MFPQHRPASVRGSQRGRRLGGVQGPPGVDRRLLEGHEVVHEGHHDQEDDDGQAAVEDDDRGEFVVPVSAEEVKRGAKCREDEEANPKQDEQPDADGDQVASTSKIGVRFRAAITIASLSDTGS